MSVTYGGVAFGVTPAGFVLPPVQVLITATNGDLLGLIDPTTDLSADQPPGQLIGVLCKKIGEVWQVGQALYNSTNRGGAEGDQLDNIGTLGGTIREGESPSQVQCTATFSAAGTYPANSLVCYPAPPAANTSTFSNVNAIVVPGIGGDGVNAIGVANTWPSPSGSAGSLTLAGGQLQLTGAAGIPLSAVGQSVTISGSTTQANNGTFPIGTRAGPTAVGWTAPAGAATDGSGAIVWVVNPLPVPFASTALGPDSGDALVAANAAAHLPYGQLNQMNPVAGWVSVADAAGVSLGTLEELDPPYRVRQYQDLSAPGSDTLDATRAAILIGLQNAPAPPGGATVQTYENTSLVVDGDGLPGKSYMAVVYDGSAEGYYAADDLIIGQALWNNHPAGIQSFGQGAGAVSVQVPDSQGVLRTVNFTRATQLEVTLGVTPYVSAATLANPAACTALVTAIQLAITNASQGQPFTLYGNTVTPGQDSLTSLVPGNDVVAEAFRAIAQGQAGVIDAQPTGATLLTLTVGGGPPNAQGNVTVTIGEYGFLSAVNVHAPALFVP